MEVISPNPSSSKLLLFISPTSPYPEFNGKINLFFRTVVLQKVLEEKKEKLNPKEQALEPLECE
jgi:hypothetical protein